MTCVDSMLDDVYDMSCVDDAVMLCSHVVHYVDRLLHGNMQLCLACRIIVYNRP